MRVPRFVWLFLAFLPILAPSLRASTGPAAAGSAAAASAPPSSAIPVKLGESAVELTGPWKFHIGDDPAWAQPDVDDTGWDAVDLKSPDGEDIPGWTARGYPGHSGYAWYRLTLNVQDAAHPLALKMPDSVDDAYQVYVNGQQIGEFGKFTPRRVTAYIAQPRAFALPRGLRNGRVTIAIRTWMDSATPFNSPDAGGLHGPPVLGYASEILSQVRLDWDDIAHGIGSGFLEMLILTMALIMALALFWLDRQEKAYLWLATVCMATLLGESVVMLVNFTTWIGQTATVILADVVIAPLRIALWVLFWASWFRLGRMKRLQFAVWGLMLLLAAGTLMLRPPLYGQQVPVRAATYLMPLLLIVKLGFAALLCAVAYFGFKRRKAEGGMAAAAVLLAAIANYQRELRLIHIQAAWSIFGFTVWLGSVSTTLSLLIITVMLLRRFVYTQRMQEQWKLEIQQAKQIQQVLIPEDLPHVPGLTIESEYRPAREVGGDFFQILPHATDGSVLIVAGDVTGKGLQAGMLVALIVGAIRNQVAVDADPLGMLQSLNRTLCGRGRNFATCLALRIQADGSVKLANAGHLPPYLNGHELPMEGALPLGMIPDADFSVLPFHLTPGDRLMLMSDGIAEAQDEQGQLFGFERIQELLKAPITAAEVASAAQNFGQQDDISVLAITRTATMMAVLA
ncbi:MAG: PP2C family protein-serine/threonine phosphatase [Acidobacteriaceae bacterium]